eukprot:3935051-Rhodomonas_salina.3
MLLRQVISHCCKDNVEAQVTCLSAYACPTLSPVLTWCRLRSTELAGTEDVYAMRCPVLT